MKRNGKVVSVGAIRPRERIKAFPMEASMLLRSYTREIFLPECNPSFESVHCIAHLGEDIREVLPYLNTTSEGDPLFGRSLLVAVARARKAHHASCADDRHKRPGGRGRGG
jgi:hypothetical protein